MRRFAKILGIVFVGFGIPLVGVLACLSTKGVGVDLPFLKQHLVVSSGTIALYLVLPVVIVGIVLIAIGRNSTPKGT